MKAAIIFGKTSHISGIYC